jgi:hypothetical protein
MARAHRRGDIDGGVADMNIVCRDIICKAERSSVADGTKKGGGGVSK